MNNQVIEMADHLRSDGKIYVVVLVVCLILVGLLGYLFLMDKRLTNIENKNNL